MKEFLITNQTNALRLSDSAFKVYCTLCVYNGPFTMTSLAIKLGKSERSISRAINEIKKHDLWLTKFQIQNDISVYNCINNTMVRGDNTYSPSRTKVRVKDYIFSLLTRDAKRMRFICKLKGIAVDESTSKESLIEVLRPYIIRFVNYFYKPGSTFLDVTEMQMIKHFEYWFLSFTFGKGRKRSKNDRKAIEEELLRADEKIHPIDEESTQDELYAELMRVTQKEEQKENYSLDEDKLTILKERRFYEEEKVYESELVSGFDA